jgi:hypothetical protein
MTTYWCDPSVQSRSKNGSSMNGSSHYHHEVGSTTGTFTMTSSSPPSTTSEVPHVHNEMNAIGVENNNNDNDGALNEPIELPVQYEL